MIYSVTVKYNELGKKLTGRNSIIVNLNFNFAPTNKQIESSLYKEVPQQMIENYEVEQCSLSELKVNDLVFLHYELVHNKYSSTIYAEVIPISNITDKGIIIHHPSLGSLTYDFNGNEITRKKYKSTIRLATEVEINNYHYKQEQNTLISKIIEFLDNGELTYLDNNTLKEIIDLFDKD